MFVTLILLTILSLVYLIHVYRSYLFFKKLGINGPRPTFFLGNVLDFARTKRISVSIHNWTQEYGRIYGYFEGHTPVLVLSDPNISEHIFLKYFSKFHSRRQFPLEDRSTERGIHLFSATGDEWRRQRAIISPTFSASNIKRMIPMINECVNSLMMKLIESANAEPEGFDIYKLYKSLTMELIWRCCFGIKTDMQNRPNNPFLLRSQQVFARESSTYLTTLLGIFIPELQPCWLSLHYWMNNIKAKLRSLLPMGEQLIADDPSEWLRQHMDFFIDEALKTSDQPDLLHLMLDAAKRTINDSESQRSDQHLLTINEVKENVYLFMIAGYETASTALAYVTHVLATHPEEQKKLMDHIDFYVSHDAFIDYDTLNKMQYLDWFIRETLRMYPITPIILNRQCSEEIHLPKLGRISPGTKFALDMYSLHYDNDLWGPVDTKIFYPERFRSKRHPLAWIAFGVGPRNCVGMKFALTEIKFAIIRLLQKYTIVPSKLAKTDLELIELVTISPKELIVRLEPRTDR